MPSPKPRSTSSSRSSASSAGASGAKSGGARRSASSRSAPAGEIRAKRSTQRSLSRSASRPAQKSAQRSAKGAPRRDTRREISLDPNDPGVVRRAQKRQHARRIGWLSLLVVAVVSFPIGMMGLGVWEAYSQARDEKLLPRQALLRDLQAQLQTGQERLKALNTPSGKERALVENGFVRSGERILLFPKETATE